MTKANSICVALDTPEVAKATAMAREVGPYVGYAKIGMEFYSAEHSCSDGQAHAAVREALFSEVQPAPISTLSVTMWKSRWQSSCL